MEEKVGEGEEEGKIEKREGKGIFFFPLILLDREATWPLPCNFSSGSWFPSCTWETAW